MADYDKLKTRRRRDSRRHLRQLGRSSLKLKTLSLLALNDKTLRHYNSSHVIFTWLPREAI
jgi:hypothetical protein